MKVIESLKMTQSYNTATVQGILKYNMVVKYFFLFKRIIEN